jgi:flagellar motor switch protein FliN/FliY
MIALLASTGSLEWIPMADDSQKIGDSEIEELLKQAQGGANKPAATPPSADGASKPKPAPQSSSADSQKIGDSEIEELLKQVQGGASKSAPQSSSTDSQKIGETEIEELLKQAQGGKATETAKPAPAPTAGAAVGAGGGSAAAVLDSQRTSPRQSAAGDPSAAGDDIQFLLQQAEEAIASVDNPAHTDLETFQFTDFSAAAASHDKATLDLLRDVELDLRIELGRTEMYLEDVLKLRTGAVVALDKMAGDPVDVYVNGRLVARGEVLVMNDNFCVRVAELISGDDTE